MTTNVQLTRTDLQRALTPEQLRATVIIRVALMLGVMIFYSVVFALYAMRTADSLHKPDTSTLDILSLVHVFLTCIAVGAAFLLSRGQLREERLMSMLIEPTPEQVALQAVVLHRAGSLLLMAPLEGAAFFGGIVCLLGVQNGTMDLNPIYWLNVTSGGIMLLVGILTFPTRERVLETLEALFIR